MRWLRARKAEERIKAEAQWYRLLQSIKGVVPCINVSQLSYAR